MKKSTIVAAIGGFIGGGLATLALSHRRKKARREVEAIVVEPDPRNEIVRQQMDTITGLLDSSIDDLAKGLDKRPWQETRQGGVRKLTNTDGDIELGEF